MRRDYTDELDQLKRDGTYRTLPPLTVEGKYVLLQGRRMLNLSGNDYLGLAANESPRDGFPFANYRMSSSSSRLLTGNDAVYTDFEQYLARAYEAPAALLWDSGYHANTGLIPVVAKGARTLILADRLVHASMIDGIRLAGVPFRRFRHNDFAHLCSLLAAHASDYDRVWILIESIYSMDGDLAPVQAVCMLKKEYPNVFVYVDEAHAVGVKSVDGLGLTAPSLLLERPNIIVGTLGKSVASVGAYSILSQEMKELAVSSARPLIYSTALPPVCVAWSRHMFEYMQAHHELRSHLEVLQGIVSEVLGVEVYAPIVPIRIPDLSLCRTVAERLAQAGYYVRPIVRPTVPPGTERLRISLSAAMSEEEVRGFCLTLKSLLLEYAI